MKKWLTLFTAFFLLFLVQASYSLSYIIDTDMGFDDWLAVLYALSNKNIDIKAITIDCQGETFCPQGAQNAAKLMQIAHRQVPIYIGATRKTSPYDFPLPIRQYASNMAITGFHYKNNEGIISHTPANVAMTHLLKNAALHHQKIAIISIGTATNIADAYTYAQSQHETPLFKNGLQMIYKGGGAFGKVIHQHVTNQDIPGNIFIPRLYPTHNKTAEWNIYTNAPAMRLLLDHQLPITFIPTSATNDVPMNWHAYHQFNVLRNSPIAKFSAHALKSVFDLQHTWKNLDFWDTAVTIAALHPSIVTQHYQAYVTVDLTKNNFYGTTVTQCNGHHHADFVWIDYRIDASKYAAFLYRSIKTPL